MMHSLILGGTRSGKTAYALRRAEASGLDRVYIATAGCGDVEMADRIARHQAERDARWTTIEEEIDLPRLLVRETAPSRVLLVDCLTLWLSNLFFAELDLAAMSTALVESLRQAQGAVIFVSNEIGLGIVPENALSRRFRDAHGEMNQTVAAACDHVAFIAAGLPLVLKG